MKKLLVYFFVFFFTFFFADWAKAESEFSLFLDRATVVKGYTVSSPTASLKLSLRPGVLSDETRVMIEAIKDDQVDWPWGLKRLSSVVQFEFSNQAAYNNSQPFYIQLSYDQSDDNYKQVFFYDKNYQAWRPLPTQDFPQESFVRSLIHLPYARLAVFSRPDIMTVGSASWYRYQGGNFAASPDWPAGSVLRVKNLANDKYVDVTVNDYGPDRSQHPDRAIDLDAVAFSKIADRSAGLIKVSLEPLKIAGNSSWLSEPAFIGPPQVRSLAAAVWDVDQAEFLFEKNSTAVRPIASLSKIFSVWTFLNIGDNRNRLEEIVSYQKQDEKYNLVYGPAWELALINLKEGDQLSIKDLIYSSLVRSANNTVESLVRLSGLKRDAFINQVNVWARENGATTFKLSEATGLDPNNVSSVQDLARLAALVFQDEIVSRASIAPSYSFKTRNDNSLKLRYNSSDLVLKNNHKNFKIIGSKTGYLDEAGYCLITAAEVNGRIIIVTLLGSDDRQATFSETVNLLNYVFHTSK